MTKENEIDFASPEAGELWAEIKAEFGDKVSIDDVEGTGKDGAITKGNVEKYFDSLVIYNEGSVPDAPTVDADADVEVDASADVDTDADDAPDEDESEDTDTSNDVSDDETSDDADDEREPIDGEFLVNKTENVYFIEGVRIEPKDKVEMTDALAESKRVAHAVEMGTLGVE